MKTSYAVKKLTPILDRLLQDKELDDFDMVKLAFNDVFTKSTVLDLVVKASYGRTDKSELYLEWVTVDTFSIIDEESNEVLSESQRKKLVKWIDNYVYNELNK